MKKNVMMRLACFLLVAVLISTSAISGTYAKYVTTANGSESARVAKWGVEVGVEGFNKEADGLFAKTYNKDEAFKFQYTVEAKDKVVAPGTKNDKGIILTLKGQPEVGVQVDIAVAVNDDVVLPAATGYTDWTESVNGEYSKKFDNAADYYPVVFKLVDTASPSIVLVEGNLKAIADYLNAGSDQYAANTDLSKIFKNNGSGEYKLTWAWDFDDNGAGTYDKQDTLLGNVAAGIATVSGANTELDFSISITVTQVD